jgi:hypothetical protein
MCSSLTQKIEIQVEGEMSTLKGIFVSTRSTYDVLNYLLGFLLRVYDLISDFRHSL